MMEYFFQNLAFGFHLAGIFQMLPLATSAPSEMSTRRHLPSRSRLQHLHHVSMKEILPLPHNPHLYTVGRYGERNKNYLPFMTPESKTTIDKLLDRNLEALRDDLAAGLHR
jgi:hypothetical protein